MRVLCFEQVAAFARDMRLSYAPVFLFDDHTTPTPTPAGRLHRAYAPKEQEQALRIGWMVFFTLQADDALTLPKLFIHRRSA